MEQTSTIAGPSGWLALLVTGEKYPEPFADALVSLWETCSHQEIHYDRNDPRPPWLASMKNAPRFGAVIEDLRQHALRLPRDAVIGVECTRATFLGFPPAEQTRFIDDLRTLLEQDPEVDVIQETYLAMAPVRAQ